MSNLRIIGLIIGILGLVLTFRIFRGPRWKRLNFVLSTFLSITIIAICLDPDLVNRAAAMLALEQQQQGRILTLLIFSNIALWFLQIHSANKFDTHRHQFDLLIRNLGQQEAKHLLEQKIKDKSIMVIIPAYNEQQNISGLLRKMPERINDMKLGVLLVDDGSSDNTYEAARQAGALVVRNRINRGQGAASRLGYDVLEKHNVLIGVTMDCDGQHRHEDIEKLVDPILQNQYDLVIGSRMLGSKEKSTLLRGLGIILCTKLINILTGLSLTDCSSGFKAFNISKMKQLELREDQFQSAEVIIEAAKKGLRISEVPITIMNRKHGQSKKGTDWYYGLNFTKTILKSWWR